MYDIGFTMIYDGDTLPMGIVIEDIRRPVSPEITISKAQIPGRNGELFRKVKQAGKVIEVDFRIFSPSESVRVSREGLHKKLRELRKYLIKEEPKKLYLSDEPMIYSMAIAETIGSPDYSRDAMLVTVSFDVPLGYSEEEERRLSVTSPITIYYDGDLSTPFVLTGTSTSSDINLSIQGEADKLSLLRVPLGQTVEIDTGFETVREGPNLELAMTWVTGDSDFPKLHRG